MLYCDLININKLLKLVECGKSFESLLPFRQIAYDSQPHSTTKLMKLYIRDTSNPLLSTAIKLVDETAKKAHNYFGFRAQLVSTWLSALYDHCGTAGVTLGEKLEDGALEAIIYLGEVVLLCPPDQDRDFEGMCSPSLWDHTAERLIGFIRLVFAKDGSVTITAFKTGLFVTPTPDEALQLALKS